MKVAQALANLTRAAKKMKENNMKASMTNTRAQSDVVGKYSYSSCDISSYHYDLLSYRFLQAALSFDFTTIWYSSLSN